MKLNKPDEEVSVAEATRKLLRRKPFLKDLMSMGAVNYRGLARNLEDQVLNITGKDHVNLDSIVMAIRRYEKDLNLDKELSNRINRVMAGSEITLKSDIVYYTFERKPEMQEEVQELYQEIDQRSGERFYVLQSDAEVGIVMDRKNSELLEDLSSRAKVKDSHDDLAMVVIDSPEEVLEADGIISYLTEKIIFNGLGLMDMFTTYTEFVLLVKESDSTDLYQTLLDVKSDSKEELSKQ